MSKDMPTLKELSMQKITFRIHLEPDMKIYHDVIGSGYVVDEKGVLHILGDNYSERRSYNAGVWAYIRELSPEEIEKKREGVAKYREMTRKYEEKAS